MSATPPSPALPWTDLCAQTLARAGHRAGGARAAVLDLLADQPCCLSAQEIHARLQERERSVGLASVYRALETLASLNLVHRVDLQGVACFERADPSGEHHHHAVCDACGRRDAFEDPDLERLIDRMGRRLGYAVGGHEVTLRGTCPACARG